MKKLNIKSYLAGVITTVTLLALTVGVFAAATGMTISVNSDIKLKVGGEDFVPKDAAGKPVFVFEYNGTTYVPMRAISEKLGYKIGYDNATRTAMIGKTDIEVGVKPAVPVGLPEDANDLTYEQFKGMFKEPEDRGVSKSTGNDEYLGRFIKETIASGGTKNMNVGEQIDYFYNIKIETREKYMTDWAKELKLNHKDSTNPFELTLLVSSYEVGRIVIDNTNNIKIRFITENTRG